MKNELCFSWLVLAACGAPATTARRMPPPSTAPTVESVCLPAQLATAPIIGVEVAGNVATVCYGHDASYRAEDEPPAIRACVTLDERGEVTGTRPYVEPSSEQMEAEDGEGEVTPTGFTATVTDTTIAVCREPRQGACRTIPHGYTKAEGQQDLTAAVRDDGAQVFVLDIQTKDLTGFGEIWGDTYDVATGKRLAHNKLTRASAKDPEDVAFVDIGLSHEARYLGNRVLVGEWYAGPAGRAVLMDPIGGDWRMLYWFGGNVLQDGKTLIVENGRSLSYVDVDTGKDLAAFEGPKWRDRAPDTDPDFVDDGEGKYGDRLTLGSHHLFVFAAPPGVIAIDPTTRTGTAPVMFPSCP